MVQYIAQVPFYAQFTYPGSAKFYKDGVTVADWGDDRYFEPPVGYSSTPARIVQMGLLASNPTPVDVFFDLAMRTDAGGSTGIFPLVQRIVLVPGASGLYLFDLPILVSDTSLASYAHWYFMTFGAMDPFVYAPDDYMECPFLFLTPMPCVA